ncbi:unnamed protein product [Adineta ricciae]|uniref:Glycolipid transfer protein domain-containing protein n=1 Tax=Adineta ricciae TaxID=249248 RepID=A0A814NLZ6_ADIRI|nr:unnamed protein product [Adineta ricciae]CAF1476270.1 unnamed protein product [Adineta ricciae]
MNITRLLLKTDYDLFPSKFDDCVKLKNNIGSTFLLYFNLPNSTIPIINDEVDDKLISTSESDVEKHSFTETDDQNSNEIVYETFFSQLSHRFSVFNSLSFEELQADLFLDTCEEYFSLVDKFNSPIFTPVKADVNGNIAKLRRKLNQNPSKFQTLFAIVNDEIESQTTQARNSATDALLWLKRAFEFLSSFLHQFSVGDKSLVDAVNKAYEFSLKPHHGMLARSVFSIALRAVPNKDDFIRSLAVHPADASNPRFVDQTYKEMSKQASDITSVLRKITLFYSKHGL